ncbi:formate dehydrogenase-N subunit alpha [Thauera linaloolentis]|uniref:Formate dehydrogenase subunit alpha n=1 Tax=Thauera linaloolentis (strain DSM 12138 / JCM 21573 / CCUG 41526 / CIP 105981 / IAM 15112 / NBRC 102519 / 47Lol) TaxID=1123367 RepID=N6Y4W6_THAL4|nr:formate dehydrogenase-N subunit alpha [Thauera linaloolentis]ENO86630.1 formate dehydrogenase subunit alpha [Thauera linaloolentis 47Lol = DSM 12138]MCM8564499.1 formate dehydrogenase-N subunit alpha [Thauera linaloolentis]
MHISRRQFFRISSAGLGASSLATLGMAPAVAHADVRQFKLLRARETRNNCTYCSVGCGILMYSLGDGAKNAEAKIFHIEGDPDHPVSRGSLCPKGSGLIDYIHSDQRLKYPEVREPGTNEWKRITWEEANARIARLLKDDRDANFIEFNDKGERVNRWLSSGMLASSAASNETGILDFKFARALGMLGMDCQARLCHGPTVSALAPSFGRGAMTNNWVDIKNANVILVMGGNPAEAHPVGFKWAVEAKVRNKATMIVVDPRYNRSAAVADMYSPIRAGSDAAFLMGMVNYLLAHDKIQHEYVKAYTNASLIVRADYGFDEGLFSGYDADRKVYDRSSWAYETGPDGYALRDETLQHPRCVLNLLKKHVERYTPDVVTSLCGTPKADFLKICEIMASTCAPDRTATFLYALGWTHHTAGAQIIRGSAMIQLLLGNIGMPGGGVNALRGHSNIQGYTDLGLLSTRLPGYMDLPRDHQQTLEGYLADITPKADLPNQVNFWKNTPKFFVSLMKNLWGEHATPENSFGYHWLPKWDRSYDMLAYFDLMYRGKVNGYIAQGFNPIAAMPDSGKIRSALSKLKFLVVIDPLRTETSNFWQNHGEFNDVDPSQIQTTVFRLPSSCFAEENGAIVNSGRWLQWHWAGQKPPYEARHDGRILGGIFTRLRELYRQEGGACPEPLLNMSWDYHDPHDPHPEEVAKEANGYALADLYDDSGRLLARKGELLSDFGQLRDDGSTASYCWIFAGSWTEAGNQMARRDNTDSGLGNTPGWAWAWPANRRILYNRASMAPSGKPWDPKRQLLHWDGKRWTGADVPDYPAASPPDSGVSPFIMLPEGLGRLFSVKGMVDGPFPEHYEPTESPLAANPLHPAVSQNPVARVFADDAARMGRREEFPYVATTYSITEMFRHWTKHARLNAIAQPEQFVEISEKLAAKKGIVQGDVVRVSSKRGFIRGKAVVTKRVMTLQVDGQDLEQVGIPCHWGFEGTTRKGFLANTLSPGIGDANTQTPEFKAFLVNVEKA